MMKISYIEVAGFRSFRERTRFDMPTGFSVITGRNGAGKSTVFDALDFALTGSINKYAVTDAKGGGLSSHIWWVGPGEPKEYHVRVGFVSDTGDQFEVKRSRAKGLEVDAAHIARYLCTPDIPASNWPSLLVHTALIRDETIAQFSLDLSQQARFKAVREAIGAVDGPDYSKRTQAIFSAAKAREGLQEEQVRKLKSELSYALTALSELSSAAARQPDVKDAYDILAAHPIPTGAGDAPAPADVRAYIVHRKQVLNAVTELLDRLDTLSDERQLLQSADFMSMRERVNTEQAISSKTLDEARLAWEFAMDTATKAKADDIMLSHLAALLHHGQVLGTHDGRCPLCHSEQDADTFAAALERTTILLGERGAAIRQAQAKADDAATHMRTVVERCRIADEALAAMDQREASLSATFDDLARQLTAADHRLDASQPAAGRAQLLAWQEALSQLDTALLILETSGHHERVLSQTAKVDALRQQLRDENLRESAFKTARDRAYRIDQAANAIPNELLSEHFDTVLPLLKELYRRLRPHTEWAEIRADFGGHVRASLNLTVGEGHNPQFLFSSGQRRAAGMAFLLALHLARPWTRLNTLLLDDPMQHIDDYRALNLVEVLAAIRANDRQIVVGVEDPALADLLTRRLRSTTLSGGRLFEVSVGMNGISSIARQEDILPLPQGVLIAESA